MLTWLAFLLSSLLLATKASFIAQSHPPNQIDYCIIYYASSKRDFKCSNEQSLNAS